MCKSETQVRAGPRQVRAGPRQVRAGPRPVGAGPRQVGAGPRPDVQVLRRPTHAETGRRWYVPGTAKVCTSSATEEPSLYLGCDTGTRSVLGGAKVCNSSTTQGQVLA